MNQSGLFDRRGMWFCQAFPNLVHALKVVYCAMYNGVPIVDLHEWKGC